MAQRLIRKPENERLLWEWEDEEIEFPRGVYSHWGDYVGDEEEIHLTGVDRVGTVLEVSALYTLILNGNISVWADNALTGIVAVGAFAVIGGLLYSAFGGNEDDD